jgi:hypothetical protein
MNDGVFKEKNEIKFIMLRTHQENKKKYKKKQ